MEKEFYDDYSRKMKELSEKEKMLRDLYIRRMALGEIYGPPTDYPNIDKPWLKFYTEEAIMMGNPKMTIFDYMKKSSYKYRDMPAISYFDREITYREVYENSVAAARALTSAGVKNNDRILYLIANIPEAIYLLYGGSQIGAVADYVDPRPESVDLKVSAEKILNIFMQEKCDHIVALDACYLALIKPIEDELRELGLQSVIVVSSKDSMNLASTFSYIKNGIKLNGVKSFAKRMKANEKISKLCSLSYESSKIKILRYDELVKSSKREKLNIVPYESDKLVAITHSSGTSGTPKPIPITHDNMNAYASQSFGMNMDLDPGDRALHVLPFFAAYGLVTLTHTGLCHATELIEVPEFKTQDFGKLIYDNRASIIIGPPSWFMATMKDSYLKNKNLSFLKHLSFGGDSMTTREEEEFNMFLEQHNASIKIAKGHGMSEVSGCGTLATREYNAPGTIGIPLPKTIYALVDPETKELLSFNGKEEIEGEMIISSESVTSGILDGKVYSKHGEYFGEDYVLSGDIAIMNRDGIIRFDSRLDRGITRVDGYKVKPGRIEAAIESNPLIQHCLLSPYYDEKRLGIMVKANIVLNENLTLAEEEKIYLVKSIISDCFIKNGDFSSRQIPTKFFFRSSFPMTPSGKVDFKELEKEPLTGEEISVDFDETTLSVGNISVTGPSKSKVLLHK